MQAATSPAAQRAIAWAMSHPDEMAWVAANMETSTFAASLAADIDQYGALTERQLAAVRRNAAGHEAAPAVTVAEIESRFELARQRQVEKPMIRLDTFVFKAAGASSANPGAIYVTEEGTYLGKITGGRFLKAGPCTDDQQERIVAAASNPAEAAKAFGQRTGKCCICGRKLTAEDSIDRFIGPICAERMGLA